jgi:hypothetical protein
VEDWKTDKGESRWEDEGRTVYHALLLREAERSIDFKEGRERSMEWKRYPGLRDGWRPSAGAPLLHRSYSNCGLWCAVPPCFDYRYIPFDP